MPGVRSDSPYSGPEPSPGRRAGGLPRIVSTLEWTYSSSSSSVIRPGDHPAGRDSVADDLCAALPAVLDQVGINLRRQGVHGHGGGDAVLFQHVQHPEYAHPVAILAVASPARSRGRGARSVPVTPGESGTVKLPGGASHSIFSRVTTTQRATRAPSGQRSAPRLLIGDHW